MQIIVTTPKKRYNLNTVTLSLITFIFCCMIVMGAAALLLGLLFQLLVLLSPLLIRGGIAILEFAGIAFLVYRIAIWLWRLVIRRLWISSFSYRRDLFLHLRSLIRLFTLILFQ